MTSEPPFRSYRDVDQDERVDEEDTGTHPYGEVVNQIFSVLTWVVLFVVLLIWAVVGAVFWIPLLLRAMLRFCVSLIESMFEGHKPSSAARILRGAVNFYRRGFVVAVEVITREEISDKAEGPVAEGRLLREILWALVVWYFIFLLFGWIQFSPLDLMDWFFSIPWAEHIRDLVDRVTGGQLIR